MLGEEYDAYLETLQKPPYRGLRVNTLKCTADQIQESGIAMLRPAAICADTFYIEDDTRLGNHPYHMGGMFYLQEPSAAGAVEILDVKEHDWVLDLCAAPGGKSTQIAAKLKNTGFLLSNEIDSGRAMTLLSNLERMGVSENMVTCADPRVLCEQLKGCFDKVLIDAPCSGEGMFKKHARAMEEWSEAHVQACAKRQLHILESGCACVKSGGTLVYSTCTYALEENEAVIDQFLRSHPEMELEDCAVSFGRSGIAYGDLDAEKVRRILPMDGGEGHFIAKMRKIGPETSSKLYFQEAKPRKDVAEWLAGIVDEAFPYAMEENGLIYLKKTPFLLLKKVKVLRQGIQAGIRKAKRIEPMHHLYMSAVLRSHFKQVCVLHELSEAYAYLQGNLIMKSGWHGYVAIAYRGCILGFGKGDGTQIKNHYPKGLRLSATAHYER